MPTKKKVVPAVAPAEPVVKPATVVKSAVKSASKSRRKPAVKVAPVMAKAPEPVLASAKPTGPSAHCEPPKPEGKAGLTLKTNHLVVAVLVLAVMVMSVTVFKAITIMGTQATMIRLMQ